NAEGLTTGCIVCNEHSPIAEEAQYPVEVVVRPEFVTGSTRMKSGTAQKLVLNMLSTAVMIQLGRVRGNKMVDMQLSNKKLVDRGVRMIMEVTGLDPEAASALLARFGNVRQAIENYASQKSYNLAPVMSPIILLIFLFVYFGILVSVSYFTSRQTA